MKRVSVYITCMEAIGILNKRDNEKSKWQSLLPDTAGEHCIPCCLMRPEQEYDTIASELVRLNTLTKDLDTNAFYDLGEVMSTERIIRIEVRSFEVCEVYTLETKMTTVNSVVLVDLVF